MKFTIYQMALADGNWETSFTKSLMERENYFLDKESFSYTQVAGNILGAPLDQYSYKEFLYELAYDNTDVHLLTNGLEKQIENEHFQSIQRIMNIHKENNGLSVNRFIAFMEGESLFPLREFPDYYIHLRNTYMRLLKIFSEQHNGLQHRDFQRVVTDVVKWSWNYVGKWIKETDYTKQSIKVIWYGEATKSEVYFLYFLFMLGIDVLVFHSEGKNIFSVLNGIEIPSYSYPSTLPLESFPTAKPTRKATVAEKASSELNQILHADGTYLFKPWQFRDYIPQSITLQSTYDEVNLITREKAFIRPSFAVENQTIYIPTIFAKILGISKERKKYWQKFQELAQKELVFVSHTFPFSNEVKGNQQYHFQHASSNGKLAPEKMLPTNWWKYKHLPEGLQLGVATAISRYVEKGQLKLKQGESLEELKQYLFAQAMDIPDEILQLLQKFDYSQDVPKIVLFNNGKSGDITRADCARLLLLNEIGFDIILFNPTGQNDIELHIDSSLFDSHWLEEISFEEKYQASREMLNPESIIKKLFSKLRS